MITKTICITDIYDGYTPCDPHEVQWIVPDSDCITSPCTDCDTDCITVTVQDDCENPCVQAIITCPSCGACKDTVADICLCNGNSDCNSCQECEDSTCVDKCEGLCDDGTCVECANAEDCEGDKICIQGNCTCPPNTTDIGGGICRECIVDEDCTDCEECNGNYCTPKQCFGKPCLDGECVDCINSGDCPQNEECFDNTCDCSSGFVRDFSSGNCVPQPTCAEPSDCPECYDCILGDCVPKVCPSGYICYQDECIEICNGLNDGCPEGFECVNLGFNNFGCVPCEGSCVDKGSPNEGTDPNPTNPNNPGSECSKHGDCGEGEMCDDGACVDCENCPDGSGGTYNNCIESFDINKDETSCVVEGILNTTQSCSCDVLTWSTEVYQRVNSQTSFRIRLRKGNAFEEGLNNIPLLSNTGVEEELPINGVIKYKVTESGYYLNDQNVSWTKVKADVSLDFTNLDTKITELMSLKGPGSICLDPNTGKQVLVNKLKVEFTVPIFQLDFENGCLYGTKEKKIYYVVTEEGGNGFYSKSDFFDTVKPLVQYDVLQSNSNRNPIFKWYRLENPITTGGQLVRQAYADKINNYKFRDAWIGINEGIEVGKYYRLESDCACSGFTFYECEGEPAELFYCNPDITSFNYSLLNCNTQIDFSNNDFNVCTSNANQDYELYLNDILKDVFTPVGGVLSIEGIYTSTTPIEKIEVKLAGIDCQDCNWTEDLSSTLIEINSIDYNCDTDILSVSISGGNGNYDIEIDDVPWVPPATINLASGDHTIKVTDSVSECEIEDTFNVDCCAIFALTANNASVCGATVGNYNFSVSGGSADYSWFVYDYEGGSLVDSGVSSVENITADLSSYGDLSFFVEVEDNKNCIVEKTVFVTHEADVDVSINNNQYCTGDTTHTIEVVVNSGELPIAFDLKQGGVSQQTGTLSSSTNYIAITLTGNDSFNLELTDNNGCMSTKPITLVGVSCPDVFITADDITICENEDLIITATITGGTAPYSWTIEHNSVEIANGTSANVSFDTGTTYSSTDGTYNFDFFVTDDKGKTDSDSSTIIVVDEFDPSCVQCDPPPTVTISSDMGWTVDDNDAVEVSHNYATAYAQTWYVNGSIVGTNATIFPDTSTPGQQDIYVQVEYTQGCFVNSNTQTLTINDSSCTCSYSFNLVSGWGSDNGNTISSDTTSPTDGCVGDTVVANVNVANCSGSQTYEWRMFRNGTLVDTKTASSYSYTIPSAATYQIRLRGEDGASCPVSEVWFEKDFINCRTCDINSDPISNATICDGQSVNKTLQVYDKWQDTDLRFRTYVDGSIYGTSPQKCNNLTTCSHTQNFAGLSVGTHNIVMEAYEYDLGAGACETSQSFTITVKAINDPSCQDCSDNTASITISGCSGSGSTCTINSTEDDSVNLSASATGSVGGFTYQWKTTGGTNVGSGSSITVGPFSYGASPQYVIHATDAEGCVFTKTANINVERDCSGGISQSFSATNGCQGDPITMSWDITNKPHYTEYTVQVRRASASSGPYSVVFTGDWNDVYNFTVASGDRWYYIDIYRVENNPDGCPSQRPPQKITKDACVDCTGVVNSISSTEGTSLCSIEPTDLTANVSGDTSGWTYTWREGTSSGGSVLGTGLTLDDFEAGSLPHTISVWYTKSGCTTGNKSITFTQASGCCPTTTPTISTSCGSSGMNIIVSNISTADRVRFDGGAWMTGTTSRTFSISTPGIANHTVEVSREFCDDPYIFNIETIQ